MADLHFTLGVVVGLALALMVRHIQRFRNPCPECEKRKWARYYARRWG
jgi:hypothetical protein